MESISFCERGLKGEICHSYMLSSKQGSIWYHFYNVFGMMQSGIEPTTIHSQGECPTTEPLVWYTCCLLRQLCRKIKLRTRYYLNHFKGTLSLAVGFEPLNHTLQHLQTNLRVLCSLCRQTWAYFAAFADKLERTLQDVQTNLSPAAAAFFWSCPWAFFILSIFSLFFCWDWIFWWPRAILPATTHQLQTRVFITICQIM